jgi:hypothetical protein
MVFGVRHSLAVPALKKPRRRWNPPSAQLSLPDALSG